MRLKLRKIFQIFVTSICLVSTPWILNSGSCNERENARQAATKGNPVAEHRYAEMLYRGEDGPIDLYTARIYFQRAAVEGYAPAQTNYAKMLALGEGGPQDFEQARDYMKRAADQDQSTAQFNYSTMTFKGLGGTKDLDQSYAYCLRAAALGHPEARRALINHFKTTQTEAFPPCYLPLVDDNEE